MSTAREDWLKARTLGIGSTDAGVIMGVNPYKSIQQLYKEKVEQILPPDISSKPEVRYGLDAEQHIRELFRLDYPQYKVEHREYGLNFHEKYMFLFATLDGQISIANPQTEAEYELCGILEIKTTTVRNKIQLDSWRDRIPEYYYCQVLHAMNVTGADFGILRAHIKLDYTENPITLVKDYKIARGEEGVDVDIELLEKKELEFWQAVQRREMPNWHALPTI